MQRSAAVSAPSHTSPPHAPPDPSTTTYAPPPPPPHPPVCDPGYGYRYSVSYCSKCPKGIFDCDDAMAMAAVKVKPGAKTGANSTVKAAAAKPTPASKGW